MKNFKNIVALGILAVSTGVSLAEVTYDAVAGSGGFADTDTDYAASGGTSAVVSSDIDLTLSMPVKAAITIADVNKNVSTNPMFAGIQPTNGTTDTLEYDGTKASSGISTQYFTVGGLLYSSSSSTSTITISSTPFTHASDSAAIVDVYPSTSSTYHTSTYKNKPYFKVQNIGDSTSGSSTDYDGTDSITTSIVGSDFLAEFHTKSYFDAAQLESLGRIGEFTAVQTITMTCP